MKTKRTWAAILAFGMLCSSAVGCSNSAGTDSASTESSQSDESAAKNAGNSSDNHHIGLVSQ